VDRAKIICAVRGVTQAEPPAGDRRDGRNYCLGQLMVAAAARKIRDRGMVFVAMRLPMLAFLVARRTHVPKAIALYENGVIREIDPQGFWTS
jgi:hypothetical protein